MQKRKIAFSCLMSLFLVLSLLACQPSQADNEVQKEFDQLLKDMPTQLMDNDNLNLEFMFEHPTNYGFKEELLTLPYSSEEDYIQNTKEAKELIKELDGISYKQLTSDQKLTYDILKDFLERGMVAEKFIVLDNSYLGSYIGFQAQLPLLLNEYSFEQKNDLESYFHVLETSPSVFQKYGENEKLRQDRGVGMSQPILDKVIEQCQNFTKDKDVFLIDNINEKIEAVDFLTDAEKSEAKKKNKDLLQNSFLKSYEDLGKSLSTIKASQDVVGLAKLPDGKAYYEYLVKSKTGIDDSIKDIEKYLNEKLSVTINKLSALALKYPDVMETLDLQTMKYTQSKSFEENLNYLSQQIEKDYPKTDKISYNVTVVPDSMKENFSPAAYLQGKIDAENEKEAIWVNGDYKQSLFTTLAHEGYAGHMYQHTYFKRLKLPTVRYMVDYNGYSEGWATYVENNSVQYCDVSDQDKIALEIYQVNQEVTQCVMSLMDIGIHEKGWDLNEFKTQLSQYFNISDEKSLQEQYYIFIESPSNYLQYYLNGMKFQDMYDHAKEKLGTKFNSVEFNQVLLDTGPAPVKILEQQVEKYIEQKS